MGSASECEYHVLLSRDLELLTPKAYDQLHTQVIRGLKFSECLSPRLADEHTSMRLRDDVAVASVLHEQVRVTIPSPDETFKPSIGSRRSSHATPSKPDSPKTLRVGDTEIELGDADTA